MTEDALYLAEGWTPENATLEIGVRAAHRPKAIIDNCKKIGTSKFVRHHTQHGEPMYRRIQETDELSKEHETEIATELKKRASLQTQHTRKA